jgi:hypothetical protein
MKTETIEQAFILNSNASLTTLNDAFHENFEKLSALVQVSMCDDFSDYPKETTYHYRSAMSDLMDELKELQKEIMQRNAKEILAKFAK